MLENPRVGGSIPPPGTTFPSYISVLAFVPSRRIAITSVRDFIGSEAGHSTVRAVNRHRRLHRVQREVSGLAPRLLIYTHNNTSRRARNSLLTCKVGNGG